MKFSFFSKLPKAFTLIELLIVIVIIGVLSTALIPRITGAQAKARDTRRLADVRALQNALEMYYMDHGRYPSSSGCGATVPNTSWCNSIESLSGGRWIANGALAPYLPGGDPVDPKPKTIPDWGPIGGMYSYYSRSYGGCEEGQYYMLIMGMETQTTVTNIGTFCNGGLHGGGGNYKIIHKQ